MKINNISSNTSFGRVIPIIQEGHGNTVPPYQHEEGIQELSRVLNHKDSELYTYSQANELRHFFKSVLGDYNGRDGIRVRTMIKGDMVLLSGKDAKDIKKLEDDCALQREILRNEKPKKNYKKLIKDTYKTVEKEIKSRLENGKSNRPESCLTVTYSRTTHLPKLENLTFSSFAQSFVKETNGHRTDIKQKKNKTNKQLMASATYQEQSLNI